MKKQIIILMLAILLVMPMVLAATETYKVNENVDLKFTCTLNDAIPSSATEFNITISQPDGTIIVDNDETTPKGNGAFNYTMTFTTVGLYKVQMFCWDGSYSFSDEGYYDVTPTGRIQGSVLNNSILIILGILGLVLVVFGATKGIPWFGFIGAVIFLLLGIYTMIYGFNEITDMYTRGVAITFIGMGFIFMFASAYEWLYQGND